MDLKVGDKVILESSPGDRTKRDITGKVARVIGILSESFVQLEVEGERRACGVKRLRKLYGLEYHGLGKFYD